MKKKQIAFSELNFPAAMNLDLLLEIANEEKLMEFLIEHSKQARLDRRIVLPSSRCMKKVFAHYLISKMKNGKTTWDKIKRMLKQEFGTLKDASVNKYDLIKLYNQREKEIRKEKLEELVT